MVVGLIATPLAYKNLRKKQHEYEQALARYNNLLSQFRSADEMSRWYQDQLEQLDAIRMGRDEDDAVFQDPPEWLGVNYHMQVGNLYGEKLAMASAITLVNRSDEDVRFGAAWVHPILYGVDISEIGDGEVTGYSGIATTECVVPAHGFKMWPLTSGFGVRFLPKSTIKQLRRDFCNKAGVLTIDRVFPGEELSGILSANINIYRYYTDENGNKIRTRMAWNNLPANVEYMGSGWAPGLWEKLVEDLVITFQTIGQ